MGLDTLYESEFPIHVSTPKEVNLRALVLAFVLIVSNVPSSQAQHHPLVGPWRSSAITQAGEQQVEIVIQANGTYSQQWRGRIILNTYTGSTRAFTGRALLMDSLFSRTMNRPQIPVDRV